MVKTRQRARQEAAILAARPSGSGGVTEEREETNSGCEEGKSSQTVDVTRQAQPTVALRAVAMAKSTHVSNYEAPSTIEQLALRAVARVKATHVPTNQAQSPMEQLALRAVARVKGQLSRGLGVSSRNEALRPLDYSGEKEEEEEEVEEEDEEEEEEEGEEEDEEEEGEEEVKNEEEGGEKGPKSKAVTTDVILLETASGSSQNTSRMKKPEDVLAEGLASSLQPGISSELYFSYDSEAVAHCSLTDEREVDRELMQRSVITADFEKKETVPPIHRSRFALEKMRKAQREKSAGRGWFDLPATQLTPEVKNDLKILKLRNALDPTQHYRANDSKQPPKYFQIGRVISGPAEYYSSRIPRKQRKRTIVEELLADEHFRKYQKRKFLELQTKNMSGRGRLQQIKHRKKFKK